jgi:hypothetical protein
MPWRGLTASAPDRGLTASGSLMLVTGWAVRPAAWVLGAGCWVLGAGCWVRGAAGSCLTGGGCRAGEVAAVAGVKRCGLAKLQ